MFFGTSALSLRVTIGENEFSNFCGSGFVQHVHEFIIFKLANWRLAGVCHGHPREVLEVLVDLFKAFEECPWSSAFELLLGGGLNSTVLDVGTTCGVHFCPDTNISSSNQETSKATVDILMGIYLGKNVTNHGNLDPSVSWLFSCCIAQKQHINTIW